jgi:hypothetical protein
MQLSEVSRKADKAGEQKRDTRMELTEFHFHTVSMMERMPLGKPFMGDADVRRGDSPCELNSTTRVTLSNSRIIPDGEFGPAILQRLWSGCRPLSLRFGSH